MGDSIQTSHPSTETESGPVAVSACLLGVACRYDGSHRLTAGLAERMGGAEFLPVCPEELGGLGTPRAKCAIQSGEGGDVLDGRARVTTEDGTDCTEALLEGASRTLQLMQTRGVAVMYAKARSPSCGCGSHSVFGEVRPGDGVTTALLKQHGLTVIEV